MALLHRPLALARDALVALLGLALAVVLIPWVVVSTRRAARRRRRALDRRLAAVVDGMRPGADDDERPG